ncbi:comF family protein [Catalinimonas alkaloidigena]|uniref:ComF family protein n=1 Tax=Catalinimonas alkaloidigena TaxID=1075417 RepID=A0A1G9EU51_9BACT|nr:comF family protein [Catalinimonas alkaloidigena]
MVAGENLICLTCRALLPQTDFHEESGENPLVQKLWGRVTLQHGMALLHYSKQGKVQRLIHRLKYKGEKEIGTAVGEWYGQILIDDFKDTFDLIVPVPLHKKRERWRGYNQSGMFGEGLARTLNVAYADDLLVREADRKTQTQKNRLDRWVNAEGIYRVTDPARLRGKHVLLVDDVVTTGATLEAAAQPLVAAGVASLSVAAIANV